MTGRFLSTPSARRATRKCSRSRSYFPHFYPRPPRGGRQNSELTHKGYKTFLSTPSARRATFALCQAGLISKISIHALREEGDGQRSKGANMSSWISIHALREEGDFFGFSFSGSGVISIHALREEGDLAASSATRKPPVFLSTPSARRATALSSSSSASWQNFYPRPPRGGRQV